MLSCCYLLPSWIWVDNKWLTINHQEKIKLTVTALLILNIYIFLLNHSNIHFIQCWEPYNSRFKLWVNTVMGSGLLISHFMHFREVSWLHIISPIVIQSIVFLTHLPFHRAKSICWALQFPWNLWEYMEQVLSNTRTW